MHVGLRCRCLSGRRMAFVETFVKFIASIGLGVTLGASPSLADAPLTITRWHCDGSNTGQNLSEHILKPANVNSASFGKLFFHRIDGYGYAMPLYVAGVKINAPGGASNGPHNVIFI